MLAEIITIGDELLNGQTIDTNSAWVARRLNEAGISINRIASVSDKESHILSALHDAWNRVSLVIMTGGLGPTSDDITKTSLAKFFKTEMVFSREVYDRVEALLALRGLPVNEVNKSQAWIPENSRLINNRLGTAPGLWFEENGKVVIALPGVPYEMEDIINREIIPALQSSFKLGAIRHRTILTYGTYEARLAEMLADFEKNLPSVVKLAYLPASGVIRLRLSTAGSDAASAVSLLDSLQASLEQVVGEYVFGYDDDTLEKVVGDLLRNKHCSLSTAESCTGGTVAHLITSVPGSSDYFAGSVVAYSNYIKEKILDVPAEDLAMHGAVSREVVESMAIGVKKLLQTDYAVATSGIAGPDGGTAEKAVGLVWIAVAGPVSLRSEKFMFGKSRTQNIRRASLTALNMLRKIILQQ